MNGFAMRRLDSTYWREPPAAILIFSLSVAIPVLSVAQLSLQHHVSHHRDGSVSNLLFRNQVSFPEEAHVFATTFPEGAGAETKPRSVRQV